MRQRKECAIKRSRGSNPDGAALDRVALWTRLHFDVPQDMWVGVSQVTPGQAGSPPETVVTFWTERDKRYELKIAKPVRDVTCEDLPPADLKETLAVNHSPGAGRGS